MGTHCFQVLTLGLESGRETWPPGWAHLFYPLGNPLRWSGDSPSQESGSESPQGREGSSPNPSSPELTASSLKHGSVRLGEGQDAVLGWEWGCSAAPPPIFFFSGSTDGPKDTSVEDALERTYVPRLKTLEEEVMEAMGIQETRRHRKVYWY